MLTETELEKAIALIMFKFDEINNQFIRMVAEQIKKIGELGQSNINRLTIMGEITSDAKKVTKKLARAAEMTIPEIQAIFQVAAQDVYTDQRFVRAFNSDSVSKPEKDAIQERVKHYARVLAMQTANTITNLSNTTAVEQTYRKVVDRAVLATTSGLTSYSEAIRSAIRDIGYNGLQVQYESGYHRRLDTAIRQNIVDATNQIAQNGAKIVGEALEYDAVEITAHPYSAPDHEPVQGRIFLNTEFEKMQSGDGFVDVNGASYSGFPRRIGEWNCRHFALPFSTRYSSPRYTEEQLKDFEARNAKGCEIDGKHYTMYQASQLMRQIETEVRRQKDVANAAREMDDDVLRRECQLKINALAMKYSQVCSASGLKSEKQRMTVEGFRMVKV